MIKAAEGIFRAVETNGKERNFEDENQSDYMKVLLDSVQGESYPLCRSFSKTVIPRKCIIKLDMF